MGTFTHWVAKMGTGGRAEGKEQWPAGWGGNRGRTRLCSSVQQTPSGGAVPGPSS